MLEFTFFIILFWPCVNWKRGAIFRKWTLPRGLKIHGVGNICSLSASFYLIWSLSRAGNIIISMVHMSFWWLNGRAETWAQTFWLPIQCSFDVPHSLTASRCLVYILVCFQKTKAETGGKKASPIKFSNEGKKKPVNALQKETSQGNMELEIQLEKTADRFLRIKRTGIN